MRLIALSILATIASTAPALAQVTTNDQALDTLKAAKPAPQSPSAPEVKAPARHPVHHPARPARPARPAVKPTPPPQVPLAPPANAVIAPPPFVMPAHPRPNPPPVPIKADAPGSVTQVAGCTRITFGTGVATLNQATHDAVVSSAEQAKANALLQVSVTAWAPGTQDDPSPPRTLALQRALAARAVMINDGLASDRVFAVSKGFDGIEAGPPDRLDICLAAPKQTPAGSPLPAPTAHSSAASSSLKSSSGNPASTATPASTRAPAQKP
jgi:outer membrane protein OmpA-like peptidoglycan-associated protein